MRLTERLTHALRDFQPDDVLGALGLERRHSSLERWLPPIGFFLGGVAVGVGIGFLFAPMTGQELRGGIAKRTADLASRMGRKSKDADGTTDDEESPEPVNNGRGAKRDSRRATTS